MADTTMDIAMIYNDDTAKPVAKLSGLPRYLRAAKEQAGLGNRVTLTGPGPVWLYLIIAHEMHGRCRELRYDSPATGPLVVFNHNPE